MRVWCTRACACWSTEASPSPGTTVSDSRAGPGHGKLLEAGRLWYLASRKSWMSPSQAPPASERCCPVTPARPPDAQQPAPLSLSSAWASLGTRHPETAPGSLILRAASLSGRRGGSWTEGPGGGCDAGPHALTQRPCVLSQEGCWESPSVGRPESGRWGPAGRQGAADPASTYLCFFRGENHMTKNQPLEGEQPRGSWHTQCCAATVLIPERSHPLEAATSITWQVCVPAPSPPCTVCSGHFMAEEPCFLASPMSQPCLWWGSPTRTRWTDGRGCGWLGLLPRGRGGGARRSSCLLSSAGPRVSSSTCHLPVFGFCWLPSCWLWARDGVSLCRWHLAGGAELVPSGTHLFRRLPLVSAA